MITVVRHVTNLYLRIFPPWKEYFKHSLASHMLDRATEHIYANFITTASYKSRGRLTPPQIEAIRLLLQCSNACMRDAKRVMQPIQAEELKS